MPYHYEYICPHCHKVIRFNIEWAGDIVCPYCSGKFLPYLGAGTSSFGVKIEQSMTEKHGSPTFYHLLEEMAVTHDKKSHDYASNDNPSGNYHFAGQMACMFSHSPCDAGFAGRLAEKIYRIANLESGGKIAKNESVEDTERDIAVIICLWMADRRDRRAKLVREQEGTADPSKRIEQQGQLHKPSQ